jgi:hypothetical protein
VASLTNAGALIVLVFFSAAGESEKHPSRPAGTFGDNSLYEKNVDPVRSWRIIGIIFYMRSMTIRTLDVLPFEVVTGFAGMAVRADIQVIRLPGRNSCSPAVSPENKTVTAADVGKICTTVNSAAAWIGKVDSVTCRTGDVSIFKIIAESRGGIGNVGRNRLETGFGVTVLDSDRMAPPGMRLNIAQAVAIQTELVLIIRHPQETTVGVEVRIMTADAGEFAFGTGT